MSKVSSEKNWFDDIFEVLGKKQKNFIEWKFSEWVKYRFKKTEWMKGFLKMNKPEKNAAAKLGYTVTMAIVATAILICMKKYKEK